MGLERQAVIVVAGDDREIPDGYIDITGRGEKEIPALCVHPNKVSGFHYIKGDGVTTGSGLDIIQKSGGTIPLRNIQTHIAQQLVEALETSGATKLSVRDNVVPRGMMRLPGEDEVAGIG